MNIFFTSPDPVECARFLDNSRLIKGTLETAQLLSNAIIYHGGTSPYKESHKNHPISVWVRTNSDNYSWALAHFEALAAEYTRRYGKIHASAQHLSYFKEMTKIIPSGTMTEKPNCVANKKLGISFQHISNTYTAYKLYLFKRFEHDKRKPYCNL
jgi:hypothetical protein